MERRRWAGVIFKANAMINIKIYIYIYIYIYTVFTYIALVKPQIVFFFNINPNINKIMEHVLQMPRVAKGS
jgi:hypothetical protein